MLTLTLKTNPNLSRILGSQYDLKMHVRNLGYPNPKQPSNTILYTLYKLAKASRSVAGFLGDALPDLELFLRQFLCIFL